jgi:hypothetical protein
MNMVITKEPYPMLILFLDKKGMYGLRSCTQFLPKGATVIAVYTKINGEVSAIAHEPYGFGAVLTSNARQTKNPPRRASKCFGDLLEQAVDPLAIIALLNDEPCHIDDVGERGEKLAEIIREMHRGPRAKVSS